MSRSPCTFRQQDVTRAVKAVIAAGIEVHKVEIDREGKIVVVSARPSADASQEAEWDNL